MRSEYLATRSRAVLRPATTLVMTWLARNTLRNVGVAPLFKPEAPPLLPPTATCYALATALSIVVVRTASISTAILSLPRPHLPGNLSGVTRPSFFPHLVRRSFLTFLPGSATVSAVGRSPFRSGSLATRWRAVPRPATTLVIAWLARNILRNVGVAPLSRPEVLLLPLLTATCCALAIIPSIAVVPTASISTAILTVLQPHLHRVLQKSFQAWDYGTLSAVTCPSFFIPPRPQSVLSNRILPDQRRCRR